MAKCEVRPPVAPEFVLTLTQDEANILRSILGKFAYGDSTSSIYKALEATGATQTIGAVEEAFIGRPVNTLSFVKR